MAYNYCILKPKDCTHFVYLSVNQFMSENQLPHLLFYGPPGTGKTSTILACARQMYTPQQFNSMVCKTFMIRH